MKRKKTIIEKEQIAAWRMLFPSILLIALIGVYPLSKVLYTSFTNKIFASKRQISFVGLSNYKKLLYLSVKKINLKNKKGDSFEKTINSLIKSRLKFEKLVGVELSREYIESLKRRMLEAHIDLVVNIKANNLWKTEYENSKTDDRDSIFRYKVLYWFKIGRSYYVIGSPNPDFIHSIINTFIFTFFSVFIELAIGMGIALVINSSFIGKGIMRGIILVPWALSPIVSAKIWSWMLVSNRTGLFNSLLAYLGISDGNYSFLTNDALMMPIVIAIDVWLTTPFVVLLLLAGLQTIPESLYEAAEVDGAGYLKKFIHITLPLLKPVIALVLVFRTLDALRVFDLFQVLLGNRLYTMASYNYYLLINYRKMGLSSAVGILIFIIIYCFAFFYIKILGVNKNEL